MVSKSKEKKVEQAKTMEEKGRNEDLCDGGGNSGDNGDGEKNPVTTGEAKDTKSGPYTQE